MTAFALVLLMLAAAIPSAATAEVPAAPPPAEGRQLRVISYNVLEGFGKSEERRLGVARWLAAQEPDVVVLLEMNGYTEERLRTEAAAWGHAHAVLLKEGGFPVGLTSRTPITDVQRVLKGFHHGLIRAHTAGIAFYATHLSPFDARVRLREAGSILDGVPAAEADPALAGAIATMANEDVIVVGDFNALSPADSEHYATIQLVVEAREREKLNKSHNLGADGGLDFQAMDRFLKAGLVDVVREKHADPATLFSFPTPIAAAKVLPRRIDYLLASPALAKTCVRGDVINGAAMNGFSDHYPVVVDFRRPATPGK